MAYYFEFRFNYEIPVMFWGSRANFIVFFFRIGIQIDIRENQYRVSSLSISRQLEYCIVMSIDNGPF